MAGEREYPILDNYRNIERLLYIYRDERQIDPSKEAKNIADYVKKIFLGKEPGEIVLIKLEDAKFILVYLIKTGRIVNPEGKPLEIEEAREIFKHNPKVWEAVLLQFYYEVSKYFGKEDMDKYNLKNISFGEFLMQLYKEKKISAETAFWGGILGKVEVPKMKEIFKALPEEKKLEIKPMVLDYRNKELGKVILEKTADKIMEKVGEKKFSLNNLPTEGSERKSFFFKIDLMGRGIKFLGLVISTIGTAIVSPQGVISYFQDFPKGIEFTLAEFLKMVVKGIKEIIPSLEIPPKPVSRPSEGSFFYLQYAFFILCFWMLIKRMQKLDWDLFYIEVKEPLKIIYSKGKEPLKIIYSKGKEKVKEIKGKKEELKLLVRAKLPKIRQEKIRIRRQERSEVLENQKLRELEENLDRSLRNIKYWVNYLGSVQRKKHNFD